MDPIEGLMFRFSEENKNLLAFVSLNADHRFCSHVCVLVPGLSDGMMSMSYSCLLSTKLHDINFSLAQVNLSSSFLQYGFGSLEQDCKELTLLVRVLKEKGFQRIVFLGHSTGGQDAMYFMRYSPAADMVCAVVLQAAVSDRDYIAITPELSAMEEEARELVSKGKEGQIMVQRFEGDPITASRYLSLAGRLTSDDMFSVDLTEEELRPILSPVRVPIFLCFSSDDKFVPSLEKQRELAARMVSILKEHSPIVKCIYLPGNHGLSKHEFYQPFVDNVIDFIKSIIT